MLLGQAWRYFLKMMRRRSNTERSGMIKDPWKQIQGARSHAQGRHFEERIGAALVFYESIGEAAVEKTPEPMRPTKNLGNGKFIAFFEKTAQPDFKGVLKGGRAVAFEAKFTSGGRMNQDRVTLDQAKAFDKYQKLGALCFVIAGFGSGGVFRIPWDVWIGMKEKYGRKYVTPEDLEEYLVRIGSKGQLLLFD